MSERHFNRNGRASGGYRPARFAMPNLAPADLEILRQESIIRREFGEDGVRVFWEKIEADQRNPHPATNER